MEWAEAVVAADTRRSCSLESSVRKFLINVLLHKFHPIAYPAMKALRVSGATAIAFP
jgi:hypothetical protein